MKIDDLAALIEQRSPLELQEEWDNSGIQIRASNDDIEAVLVALEVTSEVIGEALENKVNAIVTHHPLFFNPVKQVDCNNITGNYIIRLVREGISVYSSHTPFDRCDGGNNDYLASLLHLLDIKKMETDNSGFCRQGIVDGECNVSEYTQQICRWLGIDKSKISFSGNAADTVRKVGLCTGAGSEFIYAAKEAGCDLFITGDVKYHTAREASEMGLNLLDIGHYGSEKIFVENMYSYLKDCAYIRVLASGKNIDPFNAM